MIFNKIGGYREIHEGRYIGDGRDKSAHTKFPVILLKAIMKIRHTLHVGWVT